MKIHVKKLLNENFSCTIKFFFELENDDKRDSISYNAGRSRIFLESNYCSFDFPHDIIMPHPDLICMAALKIISPYIGSHVEMDYPVSKHFSEAVKNHYPNIKEINVGNISPRKIINERYAVSFSGGADSLATANLCPPNTPLILSTRKYHPEIGIFEQWYKTDANIETLRHMSTHYCKIYTSSDFEFLSTNHNYCIYPDNYAFTIPCILLADHLSLTGILTGDIIGAFTSDETKNFSDHNFLKLKKYYASVGLDIDSPVKGITELGTEIINRYFQNSDISTTCQYGTFKKPCMKCIKCFRKTLIKSYLSNSMIDPQILNTFNKSKSIVNLSNSKIIHMPLTYKITMEKQDLNNYDILNKIKKRVSNIDIDLSGFKKLFIDPYLHYPINKTLSYCLCELYKIFDIMNNEEKKFLFSHNFYN